METVIIGILILLYLIFVEKADINKMVNDHWILFFLAISCFCLYFYKMYFGNDNEHYDIIKNSKIGVDTYNIDNKSPQLTGLIGKKINIYMENATDTNKFIVSDFNGATIVKIVDDVNFMISGDGKVVLNWMLVGAGGKTGGKTSEKGCGGGSGGEVITGSFKPKQFDKLSVNIGSTSGEKSTLKGFIYSNVTTPMVGNVIVPVVARGGIASLNNNGAKVKTDPDNQNASNGNGAANGADSALSLGSTQTGYSLKPEGTGFKAKVYVETGINGKFGIGGNGQDATNGVVNTGSGANGSANQENCVIQKEGGSGVLILWFAN